MCQCSNKFDGLNCEYKNECGYCSKDQCSVNTGCSSCPDGMQGTHCETKNCGASLVTTMCSNQGLN